MSKISSIAGNIAACELLLSDLRERIPMMNAAQNEKAIKLEQFLENQIELLFQLETDINNLAKELTGCKRLMQ